MSETQQKPDQTHPGSITIEQAHRTTPSKTVSLYAAHKKIYAREIFGWFSKWRWVLVFLTQALYYVLPWVNWNDRPAILFDLVARKFYLFGIVLWPQDFIYLTALLVVSALALFLFTAVGGRLFCGYACPQTVYTEIFMWIENRIEGDRNARMRRDNGTETMERFTLRTIKYTAWLAVGLWTGFTFIGYFAPIRDLGAQILEWNLGGWQVFWLFFYSGFTVLQAGFMREQVCKYMCPYARFQSSMFDKDTLIVTYDKERGDPRGARSKKADPKQLGLGDCIDCGVCVHVCPTGIDIRNGLQYECIGCGACIDGCDEIMQKIGYPTGLIKYTTQHGMDNKLTERQVWKRIFRPRILLYTGILTVVGLLVFGSLLTRVPLKVDLIRDRGALGREVDGGFIENVYRIQVINTDEKPHRYRVQATGVTGIKVVGEEEYSLAATETRMFPLRLQAHMDDLQELNPGSHKAVLTIEALDDPSIIQHERTSFFIPR